MPNDSLQTQLKNILNAINAQKALRGTLPNEQIKQTLDSLYQKKAELEAQIAMSKDHSPAINLGERAVYVTDKVEGSINTGTISAGGDVVGRDKTSFHVNTPRTNIPNIPPLDKALIPLFEKIMAYFDQSELKLELAFPMGIDMQTLSGNNKQEKVYALIQRCQRQGQIEQLKALCQKARPNVDWVYEH